MFESQLLRLAISAWALVSHSQLVAATGNLVVGVCQQAVKQVKPVPVTYRKSPASGPESILWIGMKLEGGDSLLVRTVTPDSIASRYNLRAGDRIARVEGQVVDSLPTLQAALADKQRPAVSIEVVRDHRSFEMLIARPQRKTVPATITADHRVLPERSVSSEKNPAPLPSARTTGDAHAAATRSLNVSTSEGTLVLADQHVVPARPKQRGASLTVMTTEYYAHGGKLVSLSYEGDLRTVRSRVDQLPHGLRSPAWRWLGPSDDK